MGTTTKRLVALLLASVLLISTVSVDGKRLFGGSSRKSSGSGGSRHQSSSSGRTHVSSPSQHSSNHDLTRLSYANTHSQAPTHTNFGSSSTVNRGSSFGTNTHHQPSAPVSAPHATVSPIGWNVPKNQGPPPAYSPVNTVGGARTNLHESPPPYRPTNTGSAHNPSAPPYPGATNTNTNSRPFTPAQTYRPRYNGTGSFGSGSNIHTPISATNAGHGVQSSSYPRQQLPAGATYHPAGSIPAGATYHPSGSIPAGATYHPSGSIPAGATYYPSNSHMPGGSIPHGATYYPSSSHLPAGATYHPVGHMPQGATYYPSGGIPAAAHYPSAPAGATYLPAGAALPAGAVYYSQPPKSSSGLGFGSGLAAGALGGALLGHALTPSRTQYVQPSYNPAPSQGHDDKVIIINNGPPGSVTTTNAGDGVTVINAGQQQAQPAQPNYQPQQPVYQPAQPAPAQPAPAYQPAQPVQTPMPAQPAVQPGAPLAPVAQPPAVAPANPTDANTAAQQPTAAQEPPPPGGIICVPVKMQQPDPKDATKTIEVEQIACYPAPPPEATANSTVVPTDANAANAGTTTLMPSQPSSQAPTQLPTTTKDGAVLAPFQSTVGPFVAPEGSVPLAPLNPSSQPDIYHIPGEPTVQHHSSSQAMLAPGSNVHDAHNAASKHYYSFAFSSLLSLMLAYCLH